jgi:hypothetical protein
MNRSDRLQRYETWERQAAVEEEPNQYFVGQTRRPELVVTIGWPYTPMPDDPIETMPPDEVHESEQTKTIFVREDF